MSKSFCLSVSVCLLGILKSHFTAAIYSYHESSTIVYYYCIYQLTAAKSEAAYSSKIWNWNMRLVLFSLHQSGKGKKDQLHCLWKYVRAYTNGKSRPATLSSSEKMSGTCLMIKWWLPGTTKLAGLLFSYPQFIWAELSVCVCGFLPARPTLADPILLCRPVHAALLCLKNLRPVHAFTDTRTLLLW